MTTVLSFPDAAARRRASRARVKVFPSPDGTVTMIATTADGGWVAELRITDVSMCEDDIEWLERRAVQHETWVRMRAALGSKNGRRRKEPDKDGA